MCSYTHEIEAVSCDEAYLDVSALVKSDVQATALTEQIRREIHEETSCTASAGIGELLTSSVCVCVLAAPGSNYADLLWNLFENESLICAGFFCVHCVPSE